MLSRTICRVPLVAILLLAAACGGKSPAPPVRPESLVVFPPPPDTGRIQFLARYGDSRDFEEEGTSFLGALAGEGEETKVLEPLVKPYGVTMLDARIYVCDPPRPGIEVLDLRARRFSVMKPARGGELQQPINCAGDPAAGALYVADMGRGEVVVLDTAGAFLGAFGGEEVPDPVDVFVDGDRVYVASLRGHRVVVYDRESRLPVDTLPDAAPDSPEGLRQTTNIWVEGGRLYASDFGDFKVKVYGLDGTFERSVGQYGNGFGMFVRPKGIAVDRDGILYAVDAGFENVQMFNPEGDLLMFFGGPFQGTGSGTMYLPAKVIVDYDHVDLFRDRIHPDYEALYLVIVTNQYGTDKVTVYARIEPKPGTSVGEELPAAEEDR